MFVLLPQFPVATLIEPPPKMRTCQNSLNITFRMKYLIVQPRPPLPNSLLMSNDVQWQIEIWRLFNFWTALGQKEKRIWGCWVCWLLLSKSKTGADDDNLKRISIKCQSFHFISPSYIPNLQNVTDRFSLKGQDLLSKELNKLKNAPLKNWNFWNLLPLRITFFLLGTKFTIYSHLRINQPFFRNQVSFSTRSKNLPNCCIVIFNFCQIFRAPHPIFLQIGFENWKHNSITSQIKTNVTQNNAIKVGTVMKLLLLIFVNIYYRGDPAWKSVFLQIILCLSNIYCFGILSSSVYWSYIFIVLVSSSSFMVTPFNSYVSVYNVIIYCARWQYT